MAEVAGGQIGYRGAVMRSVAALAASLMMGGCSGLGGIEAPDMFAASKPPESQPEAGKVPQSELQKATEYWGQEYSKKSADLDVSLNYAKNLKALGQKQKALEVLQQAALFHANDRKLNSEYGRLALELDQVSIADQLLQAADDPANPDWHVVSARGTVLAKQGKYKEAIPFYERALLLSADQPSVMNNLALAYAMNGEAAQAEEVLRRATASGGASAKVRQNLALVLGLQGKYDEATKVGSEVNAPAMATANTDIIKQMVRLEAKPYAPIPAAGTWAPAVVAASAAPVSAPSAAAPAVWQTKVAAAVRPQPAALKPAAAPSPQVADDSSGAPALRPSTR